MKHLHLAALILGTLLVLGALFTPNTALAQVPTRDRVQLELDRTDERIDQAQSLVAASTVESARLEVNEAVVLQARARLEFTADHLRFSRDLPLRARARADRAIAMIRGLPDPDRVLTQLERTRELLERSRDRIEECDNDRARAMLRAAFGIQLRAEAAAREGRTLAALQLTMGARERALKALRACNLSENLRDSAERALHRTDEVIARARDRVADHDREPARISLSRAVEFQGEAWVDFRAERYEASLRRTQSARAFAHRAIRMADAP